MGYWIMVDICSDLPKYYVDRYEKFKVLPMNYSIAGQEYAYKVGDEAHIKDFYQQMSAGAQATTSQITVMTYQNAFREVMARGEDLLCMCLSSGISGSLQSALMARDMVREEFPNGPRMEIVDSLCASLGFGLLTDYALQNRAQGMSLTDNAQWLIDNRQKLNHWFTVDDLNHLFRGGRVTRSAALIGSMLRIKPVLRVNEEGKLVPFEKVQGRKRSLKALADKAIALSNPKEGQKYFISHGDCQEDAQYVADLIKEGLPNTGEFMLSPCGAVIGAHSGPGTVALFFMGDHR